MEWLEPIKRKYGPALSYADLYTLAGVVAIKAANGPVIFRKFSSVLQSRARKNSTAGAATMQSSWATAMRSRRNACRSIR